METIANILEKILEDLEEAGDIELSAIVSRQGLLMVSREKKESLKREAFAALTATLYNSAESTTLRLSEKKPKTIIVETGDKNLITYAASSEALIVVLVGKDWPFELVLNELRKAAEKVNKFI
jgi:predicted regulator of Ras-like GTPase activity (Roadblock/LC7/MglB family)